jgi:hypothetical protein
MSLKIKYDKKDMSPFASNVISILGKTMSSIKSNPTEESILQILTLSIHSLTQLLKPYLKPVHKKDLN